MIYGIVGFFCGCFFYGYEKCVEINYLFKEIIIIDKRYVFIIFVGWDVGFVE